MTRVGFYVVQAAGQQQRFEVAARLADKAFRAGHRIHINVAAAEHVAPLSDLLWSFRRASFLPNAPQEQGFSDLIAIGCETEPPSHDDLLINLHPQVPVFFSRFQRVAQIVSQDSANLAASREAWTFYKSRGYPLEKHDV